VYQGEVQSLKVLYLGFFTVVIAVHFTLSSILASLLLRLISTLIVHSSTPSIIARSRIDLPCQIKLIQPLL